MTWPTSETDLAAPVIAYLEDLQWDVYQEVEAGRGDDVADIIATQGRLIWAIELKRSLSLEVLAQAARWHRYCHYASVAVPVTRRHSKGRALAEEVMRWKGIGCFQISAPNRWQQAQVSEYFVVKPRLNRRPYRPDRIRDSLTPQHKTFAIAGNADGQRWTPFKQTCREVVEAIRESPGLTMKQLVDRIGHHYASASGARISLAHWIEAGKVEGVCIRREGRRLSVWPVDG